MTHQNSKKGFTIIEVMIVLAIAGLIMAIVFLAVPALQRSSRNTQRKTDASNILSSIADYVSNNGGTLPTSSTFSTAIQDAKLGYYDSSTEVTFGTAGTIPTEPATGSTETIYFVPGLACTTPTTPAVAQSARAYALVFWLEGANTTTEQCIGS